MRTGFEKAGEDGAGHAEGEGEKLCGHGSPRGRSGVTVRIEEAPTLERTAR